MNANVKLVVLRGAIAVTVAIACVFADTGFDATVQLISAGLIGVTTFVLLCLAARDARHENDESEAFYFSSDQSPSHYPPHERH
jgi:hypothetical protein